MKEKLVFTILADLHYKEGMYLSSVSDIETIIKRAQNTNSDFIIHCGDFSNDYKGSPELIKTFLENVYDIPVYGVYGNHELESIGNNMDYVTPLLTNKCNDVIWGTENGKIKDGSVGYYYFDIDNFRIICTDTNYSYNTDSQKWQHNTEASWGAPNDNISPNSLGTIQLNWLRNTLLKSAEENKKCIIVSHATFNTEWNDCSPDSKLVCEMFETVNSSNPGTVLIAINGHYHTNRISVNNNIVFFDVNTVRNGYWALNNYEHYTDEHTFNSIKYDENGKEIKRECLPLTTLSMSKHTWFHNSPLSAVVTITENNNIKIEGAKTEWLYDIVPEYIAEYKSCEISDYKFISKH